MLDPVRDIEIRHAHLFCGLGGGARGFNRGEARVGLLRAKFRCLGGIDVDPAAIRDFGRLAGVPGTVLDLFSAEQYRAFHDRAPPPGWREAGTADIHAAFGHERPHIAFLSAPCKGFSGLLAEKLSRSDRYQALNGLTLRGVWLLLEAYADDPIELIVFENVPRIASRGRALLDQIVAMLRHYGYAVAETTHDCGELGALAQSRKRFLLVARHVGKVPPFLYQPERHRLRGVGEVLDRMPLPGDPTGGPMHRVPALQWRTWVRLAFVEAGSDWRSLNRLRVEGGVLADYGIAPDASWHQGVLGVQAWAEPAHTVTSRGGPTNGAYAVADPRPGYGHEYQQLGVGAYAEPASTIINVKSPGQGRYAVADPRLDGVRFNSTFRIVRYGDASPAIAGAGGPGNGLAVADPRVEDRRKCAIGVREWSSPLGTVAGESLPPNGAFSVADPRQGDWQRGPNRNRQPGDAWAGAGHYGVISWTGSCGAVSATAGHDNGRWSVADPRIDLPLSDDRLVCRIVAEDGTWHRPFTTLELAALQSLVDPEEHLELDGLSDSAWRERIGNAVPPAAAQAIAGVMGTTLLLAWSGETFMLSSQPIWVRPVAVALAVRGFESEGGIHG